MFLKPARHWIPTVVLLLGIMSICLLLWTNRISEKQRETQVLMGAIMDIQIHVSTFHLWLEEFIGGNQVVDMTNVWKDLEKAEVLTDIILKGGETEHGPLIVALTNPQLRVEAESIKSMLRELKGSAQVRLSEPATSGIGSAINQRFDELFERILIKTRNLENTAEEERIRNQVWSEHLFLSIESIWTFILAVAVLVLWNWENRRSIAEKALLLANEQLQNQTAELAEHRERLSEMVRIRTEELTSVNESLQLEIGERKRKEDALKTSQEKLRYLSNELLTAQDNERKRISGELHDELGQSLTLLKLQLRSVKMKLREDQGTIKEECDNILKYISDVIENVRRLAADLSPYILEDIGLTGALRWLIKNYIKTNGLAVTLNITKIDNLVSPKDAIHLYRIFQEALTNTIKHSEAKNVSIVIGSDGERISLLLEDDGVGFDAKRASKTYNTGKGLGLASMEERISMLGGSMKLSSEAGRGTRIVFTVPIQTGTKAT